jgi:hypothetical protein
MPSNMLKQVVTLLAGPRKHVRRRSALSVVVGDVVEAVDVALSLDGAAVVLGMSLLLDVRLLLCSGDWLEDALATELCVLRKQLKGATFELQSVPGGGLSPRSCFETTRSVDVRLSTLTSVVMLVSSTTFIWGVPVAMQATTARRTEWSLIL